MPLSPKLTVAQAGKRHAVDMTMTNAFHRLKSFNVIAVLVIIATLILLFVNAPITRPLNCDMECGETLLALRAGQQFRAHGIDYGLLENLGSHEDPNIYTHNVNIGTLTFVGLEALGIPDRQKFLLPLLIYGLGLAYIYLTVRRISGNEVLALVTLLLFSTTYWGLGAFALNALRAWHMLGLFAAIFHTYGMVREKNPRWDYVGICFGSLISFGCGYDFWIITAAVALMVALFNAGTYSIKRLAGISVTLGLVFAVPFLLRQIHVAWAMGLAFWEQDFIYSVAIKIPYAADWISIPSLDVIDAYYKAQHVMRPPAQPSNSASQIFFTFRHMITSVTLPRWGVLACVMPVCVLAIIVFPRIRATPLGGFIVSLILPCTLGIVIGLVIFAPFSLHVYFKHEFPLIAFVILLAKAAVVYFLLSTALRARGWKTYATMVALLVVVVDTAMVHWNNSTYGPAQNYAWGHVFHDFPNEKIGIMANALPPHADPYIGIDENRAVHLKIEQLLSERPDLKYRVYQPSDRFVDFDSPRPMCNWVEWVSQVFGLRWPTKPGHSCIYDQPLPPTSVRQPSVDSIIDASSAEFSVLEHDKSTNGYVILQRRAP